jgi:CRISPR-associated protein Cas5a/b/c
MMSLRVELQFAWGYSVKAKKVSKAQHAHSLPPPTTLIGAISKGLAKIQGKGEILFTGKKSASQAAVYATFFKAASAFLISDTGGSPGIGKYWEDPGRYQILQFQKPTRRGLTEYRFGLVPAGKVYCPSTKMIVGFLVDEDEAKKVLGADWDKTLLSAAYSTTHIGAKESITAVEDVTFGEAELIKNGEFETRFYLPADAVEVLSVDTCPYGLGGTYVESFWKIGYEWGVEQQTVDYIVPGSRDPVTSCRMHVRVARNIKSYMVGEDGLTIFT